MENNEIKNETELKILDYLRENPSGSTITDVSNEINIHRNTVSKYLKGLDEKNKVRIKEIGAYKLYYTSEKDILPKRTFIKIYKGILYGLKKFFPNKEDVFKELGKELVKFYPTSIGNIPRIINELNSGVSLKFIMEVVEDIYQGLFQDSIILNKIEINNDDEIIKIRYSHSTFLIDSDDFIYHIYMLIGYIEKLLSNELNTKFECSIEDIYISDNKKESYVDILIQN